MRLSSLAGIAAGTVALAGSAAAATDFTVPSGITLFYDTSLGPIVVDNFRIESGGALKVVGTQPFALVATETAIIAGDLDLSGSSAKSVATIGTGNQPEPGAAGGAGGGPGGIGSFLITASTPLGGVGFGALFEFDSFGQGGQGGESGFGVGNKNNRRPGGGGGGALAADQPVHPDPLDLANIGLVAQDGFDGSPTATGAISNVSPPLGGDVGERYFVDGTAANDFWGLAWDGANLVIGEASAPTAGRGGGAGGDAINATVFPHPVWSPTTDEKGAGGGGGGGLGFLAAKLLRIEPGGRILSNGGRGGSGENTIGFDNVGGGSGGGSGGWLILQALRYDFSAADDGAIQALGGRGGQGKDGYSSINAGGNGGPGVIQLHTRDGSPATIQLPGGKSLGDLTTPQAKVLLPFF